VPTPKGKTGPKDAHVVLSGLIIQIVLLVLAIFVYLYITAQYYAIKCEKNDLERVNCSLRTTVLGVLTLQEKAVTDVAAAVVKDDCEGASCRYRIELRDYQGVTQQVDSHYGADPVVKEKLNDRLYDFVNDPEKTEIYLRESINARVFLLPVIGIIVFIVYRLLFKQK